MINATLYYNLGSYQGNNYESAVITAQNAINDYPYSKYKEDLAILILKSRFEEALQSVEEKQEDRFRDVVDEYYAFANEYPDSKYSKDARKILESSSKRIND